MTEQGLFNIASMSINQILDALTPEIRRDKRAWSSVLLELVAVVATHNIEVEKLESETGIVKAKLTTTRIYDIISRKREALQAVPVC